MIFGLEITTVHIGLIVLVLFIATIVLQSTLLYESRRTRKSIAKMEEREGFNTLLEMDKYIINQFSDTVKVTSKEDVQFFLASLRTNEGRILFKELMKRKGFVEYIDQRN